MNEDELRRASDENFWGTWRVLSAASPGGEVECTGGVLLASSGAAVAFFNGAFITEPDRDPLDLVNTALDFYRARGLPFLLRVREDLAGGIPAAAIASGLVPAGVLPGMALSRAVASAVPDPPAGLSIRRATDEDGLEDHKLMLVEGFEMAMELVEALVTPTILDTDLELYVGSLDGKPVTSSALFVCGGVAGVYNVATPDVYRKRGYGEAMTWHAVKQGLLQGATAAVLQASPMGQPIYERMGFRTVAPYIQFEATV